MAGWVSDILTYVVPAIATGLAGWLFGRGKQKEEVHSLEMDNVAKAVEIWRGTAEQVRVNYEDLSKEVRILKNAHTELEREYRQLQEDHRKLTRENNQLRKRISNLENENERLKGHE